MYLSCEWALKTWKLSSTNNTHVHWVDTDFVPPEGSQIILSATHILEIQRMTVVLTRAWETPSQFCIRITIEQPGYDLLVEITWIPKIGIDFSSRCSSHSYKGVPMWDRVFWMRPLEVRSEFSPISQMVHLTMWTTENRRWTWISTWIVVSDKVMKLDCQAR